MGKVINYVELTAIPLRIEQFVHYLDHKVTDPFNSFGTELMQFGSGPQDLVYEEDD